MRVSGRCVVREKAFSMSNSMYDSRCLTNMPYKNKTKLALMWPASIAIVLVVESLAMSHHCCLDQADDDNCGRPSIVCLPRSLELFYFSSRFW